MSHPDGIYVIRAAAAIAAGSDLVVPYLTTRCPECDREVHVSTDTHAHLIYEGWVIVGCEGFYVINPNLLGIPTPEWSSWLLHRIPDVPETVEDARQFIIWCEHAIGPGFHPEDDPANLIEYATDQPTFTPREAEKVSAGLHACWALLDDVNKLSCEVFDQLHPEMRAR